MTVNSRPIRPREIVLPGTGGGALAIGEGSLSAMARRYAEHSHLAMGLRICHPNLQLARNRQRYALLQVGVELLNNTKSVTAGARRNPGTRVGGWLGRWSVFFRGFLEHPRMVGSIIPSSRFTIEKMLAPVDWDECKVFVEYGPGVGTFCGPILERMSADAILIAIDTNPLFIEYLEDKLDDARFHPVQGSAAEVEQIVRSHGRSHADYILSGLPFSTLPEGIGPAIAASTHRILRPGGGFLVYQFSAKARDYMARHFDRIDQGFELWNVLPVRLFWGWKAASL